MIKTIHFIWVDKHNFVENTSRLPKKYQENIDSWRKNHSEWNIIVWNGEMIDKLIHDIDNIEVLTLYKKYKNFICKVDFAKLVILFFLGGLYVDVDTPCQKNIEDLISNNNVLLVKEPRENCKNYRGLDHLKMNEYIISNAILYSEKQHPFFNFLIALYNNHIINEDKSILLTTGPPIFNMAYLEWPKIEPNFPICLKDEFGITKKEENGYCYTTFDNTWTYNKLWTSKIFQDYYFYPKMSINNYFGKEKTIEREVEHILGSIAFNTNLDYFFSIPALMDLELSFKSEMEGVFINKAFFRRNVEIPRIIHQVWIGNKPKPISIMNTWKKTNLKVEFWDETRIESEFPGLFDEPMVKNCNEISGKVDIIRIFILKKYGGIYVDADTIALKTLPDDLFNHNMFLGFESEMERGSLVNNCVIGSIKDYYVLDIIINEYKKYHQCIHNKLESVVYYSPGFFTNFLKRNPQLDIFIYPSYYFRCYGHDGMRENTFLTTQSLMNHVGRFDGRILAEVHNILTKKEDLGYYLNALGLKGKGVIVGYDRGEFAKKILSSWEGEKVLLVEGEPYGIISKEILKKRELIANLRLLDYCDKYDIISSENCILNIMDNSLDFIYLDNKLTENQHFIELCLWWNKLKPGGILLGNNYNNIDVSIRNQNVGIREAVNRFKDSYKIGFQLINKTPITTYLIRK